MSEREGQVMSRVIKRNGEEVSFDLSKIVNAIKAANEDVDNIFRMNEYQIQAIANDIAQQVQSSTHAVNVEDIQDMVETVFCFRKILCGRMSRALSISMTLIILPRRSTTVI